MHGLEGYLTTLIRKNSKVLDASYGLKVSFPCYLFRKDASVLFCELQEHVV